MTTFTFKGVKHTVHHWPITMRYADRAKAMMERINEVVERESNGLQMSMWRSVLRNYPDISRYVTADGSFNVDTIAERVQALRGMHPTGDDVPPFDEAAAIKDAQQWCQQRLQDIIVEQPELARTLSFSTGAYPTTVKALSAGVSIVKEIVDRERTAPETLALIDAPIEHDFWQDINASEVASFIDLFCQAYK